jgi:hypothetical protein
MRSTCLTNSTFFHELLFYCEYLLAPLVVNTRSERNLLSTKDDNTHGPQAHP